MLDSECKMRKILVQGIQDNKSFTQVSYVDLSFNSGVADMVAYLDKQSWYDIILNDSSILCLLKDKTAPQRNNALVFSVHSKSTK